jgi:hypothetical protein
MPLIVFVKQSPKLPCKEPFESLPCSKLFSFWQDTMKRRKKTDAKLR